MAWKDAIPLSPRVGRRVGSYSGPERGPKEPQRRFGDSAPRAGAWLLLLRCLLYLHSYEGIKAIEVRAVRTAHPSRATSGSVGGRDRSEAEEGGSGGERKGTAQHDSLYSMCDVTSSDRGSMSSPVLRAPCRNTKRRAVPLVTG